MIEHSLPFPAICQKAAVTHCFSIFADIFFIKHICLWSKDAYSYFLQSTAGEESAKSKGETELRGQASRLAHQAAAVGLLSGRLQSGIRR